MTEDAPLETARVAIRLNSGVLSLETNPCRSHEDLRGKKTTPIEVKVR